jgi:lipopolysaccharide biosynthesis regulator YciM
MKHIASFLVLALLTAACNKPEESSRLMEEANKLYFAGKTKPAIEKYEAALSADKHNLRAALMLGKVLVLDRSVERGVEVLEKAVDRHPTCLECRYWLAVAKSQNKASQEEALKILDSCLQDDSQNIAVWTLRGQIQEARGDAAGAVLSYGEARRIGRELSSAERRLAVLYRQAGLEKKAQTAESRAKLLLED